MFLETKKLLEGAGFVVESIELFERPTPLPGDVGGWVSTFAKDFLASFDAENREDFVNDVIEHCKPKLMQADGHGLPIMCDCGFRRRSRLCLEGYFEA